MFFFYLQLYLKAIFYAAQSFLYQPKILILPRLLIIIPAPNIVVGEKNSFELILPEKTWAGIKTVFFKI